MSRSLSMRCGLALPITLLALVVIGILVAGGFFASTQEYRVGRGTIEQERVSAAAEGGLSDVVTAWDGASAASMAIGEVVSRSSVDQQGITTTTVLSRLSPLAFWATSEARSSPGLAVEARRRVGAVVHLEMPHLWLPGALTVRLPDGGGAGDIGPALSVTGMETAPAGWDQCRAFDVAAAGFVTDGLERWTWSDAECSAGACFEGTPPSSSDPRVADSVAAAEEFDRVWRLLTAGAGVVLAGRTTVGSPELPLGPIEVDGVCDRGVVSNWGDPGRSTSCAGHFPVIRATGDLHVAGGQGQGVLLVEGDLVLSGGATFVGLVLVRGALRTVAPGAHVIGAVRVLGDGGRRSSLAGGGRFAYSRCALLAALAPRAPARIEPRSWVELRE